LFVLNTRSRFLSINIGTVIKAFDSQTDHLVIMSRIKFYALVTGGVVATSGLLYTYIQYQKLLRKQAEEELLKLQLEVRQQTFSMFKMAMGVGCLSVLTYGVLYTKRMLFGKSS
jgi:hypothetical protein